MNINEIIAAGEISNIRVSKKFIKVTNYIKTRCSQILKLYKETDNYLYHGFKDKMPLIFMGNPRDDRKPMDTDIELQKEADRKLKEAGFNALRSNSIFCTNRFKRASSYGEVYIIFPLNGFNYTYSDKLYDFYMDFSMTDLRIFKKLPSQEFVHYWKFKNKFLGNILDSPSGNEIYINGPYIAVGADNTYHQFHDNNIKLLFDNLGLKI